MTTDYAARIAVVRSHASAMDDRGDDATAFLLRACAEEIEDLFNALSLVRRYHTAEPTEKIEGWPSDECGLLDVVGVIDRALVGRLSDTKE